MKPPGLRLGLSDEGLTMRVVTSSRIEDAIWDAVQQALVAGWTVEDFRREAAEAWQHELRERAECDATEWARTAAQGEEV